jgi:methylase of polypeptide subunit release factors
LLLEIGHRQGETVHGLLRDAGFGHAEIRPDLAGRDRIAYARR